MKQAEVLLPTAAPHGFDYRVPDDMTLVAGDIVSVPFGRGQSLGVVWGEGKADLPAHKIKPISLRHEQFAPLSEAMRGFIDWSAWYNCAPKGAMLKMVLPIADIDKEGRIRLDASGDAANGNLAALSSIQEKVAVALEDKLRSGFSVTLLDGVTGSGKTEVYFSVIAKALESENQILMLLPEIALSVQWLDRFEKRFGFTPIVWNSTVTSAKKRASWQAINKGEARVIVGARSALFLPYKKLGLIIADEEHDQSYKQEDGVIYHARDMAVARARFEKLPLVLVSATPSLETYYNAQQGKYGEVSLPSRHAGAEMPDIQMIDMRQAALSAGNFVSPVLREQLANTVAAGHQAMLFLNRRGYAPLLLCRACGHRFQCTHCSSWMVMHKKGEGRKDKNLFSQSSPDSGSYLQCHHCDYRQSMPSECPACHAAHDKLAACGPGVERLTEEVSAFLPQARVAVMASDSMDSAQELSDTINAMTERRIDVLIGTQMIAKGHHFADLALVGVVDADLGLNGGDLRAAERTYQLLHQISGRAGREQVKGHVFLQSFLPEHPVMKALISGDRDAFLRAELQARKNAHMPPFSRLAAVIVEGTKEEIVMQTAKKLAATFSLPRDNCRLLGPAPAPLYRLSNKFRYRLLVRADRTINLPDLMRAWVDAQNPPSSVRIKIDIDPMNFL
jgi:primosomal protein N' (replication factor Y)